MQLVGISKEEEKKEFILGTLFPDIRYLKVLSRRETHELYPSLAKVRLAPTLFEAGKIFHAWVDEIRGFYLARHQIYDQLSFLPMKSRGVFLKFLEDEMVFPTSDWKKEKLYLEELLSEEKELAPEASIKKWHFILAKYISARPSQTLSFLYFFHQPKEAMPSWKEDVERCASDPYWQKHLRDLSSEMESKMKRFLAEKK